MHTSLFIHTPSIDKLKLEESIIEEQSLNYCSGKYDILNMNANIKLLYNYISVNLDKNMKFKVKLRLWYIVNGTIVTNYID